MKGNGLLYELCAVPFIILFEDIFIKKNINFKSEKMSKWSCLIKLCHMIDFYSLLSEYNIETLERKLASSIEELLSTHSEYYNLSQLEVVSKTLANLMRWVYGMLMLINCCEFKKILGLIEIHKYIRKYYVSLVDKEILSPVEMDFCRALDFFHLRSYKLLRSIELYYSDHEEKAGKFLIK